MNDSALAPTLVQLAHEDYLNHLLRCRGCYAPSKRYCSVGQGLRIEYDAQYLGSIEYLPLRRALLLHENVVSPKTAGALKARVLELYRES